MHFQVVHLKDDALATALKEDLTQRVHYGFAFGATLFGRVQRARGLRANRMSIQRDARNQNEQTFGLDFHSPPSGARC
jgi:hypothetical protein